MTRTTGAPRPEDARFMAIALRQAEAAVAKGQTPCGAVILDRHGQIVGEGHNTVRADKDPTSHGEGSFVITQNVQADWSPLEVVGEFMRAESLKIIARFDFR